MEDFIFKPKYSFVNVYLGAGFSALAIVFFIWLGIAGRSIPSVIFSGLFIFALASAAYVYPNQVILHSHEIIVRTLLFPNRVYSLFDIQIIRFLRKRIEFSNGKFYFGSIKDYSVLVNNILERMYQLNIPINTDEDMKIYLR